MVTDPIADMLTSIRNAQAARKGEVRVRYSRLKHAIADVLRREGYLGPVTQTKDGDRMLLDMTLLYDEGGQPQIRGVQRISRPGRRWSVRKTEIPRVLSGLGMAILSTSQGLLTDAEARKRGVGGEVVCRVW